MGERDLIQMNGLFIVAFVNVLDEKREEKIVLLNLQTRGDNKENIITI